MIQLLPLEELSGLEVEAVEAEAKAQRPPLTSAIPILNHSEQDFSEQIFKRCLPRIGKKSLKGVNVFDYVMYTFNCVRLFSQNPGLLRNSKENDYMGVKFLLQITKGSFYSLQSYEGNTPTPTEIKKNNNSTAIYKHKYWTI